MYDQAFFTYIHGITSPHVKKVEKLNTQTATEKTQTLSRGHED